MVFILKQREQKQEPCALVWGLSALELYLASSVYVYVFCPREYKEFLLLNI